MSEPIRALGEVGVITDINPYDLPPNAVSRGVNVRFQEGKIGKAPAFRRIFELTYLEEGATIPPVDVTPSFLFDFKFPGQPDLINIVSDVGSIYQFDVSGALIDVTNSSFTPLTPGELPFTHTVLQEVSYLNRVDMHPQVFHDGDTEYDDLDNWDVTHKCRALRGFKDYLIALNVTKGSDFFPTMFKWSNNALFDTEPDTWDPSDTTANAGENVLGDATSGFLDGLALGNQFFFYNDSQTFRAVETGTNDIFDFKLKFNNRGIVNTNCVVEHNGLHYVFDSDDIYVHDGVQTRSICEGSVRKYIYRSINLAKKNLFFVFKNPGKNTIHFCYQSADDMVSFDHEDTANCNRAAVYDTVSNTWTFDDLPNVVGWAYATLETGGLSYEEVTTSYEETGGTYAGEETGDNQHLVIGGVASVGDGLDNVLYGFDPVEGGILPYPLDETATMPAIAFRIGIDLDDSDSEIRAHKYFRAFYPQVDDFDLEGVSFKFAATPFNVEEPSWGDLQTFDPATQWYLNPNLYGRYLSWYVVCEADKDFRFGGFDLDAVTTSYG